MASVTPFLWFDDDAEQAMDFYASVFEDARIVHVARAGSAMGEDGPVVMGTISIGDTELLCFNGGPHLRFNEAVSLFVSCDSPEEVDRLWSALSAGGSEGRCGWLKDRFGLSWQIIPKILGELLGDPDPARAARVRDAMLAMGKIDSAKLIEVHRG